MGFILVLSSGDIPILRRLLTDYGFVRPSLAKGFSCMLDILKLRYNFLKGALIYVPIKLNQEYRYFRFENPWI